MVLHHLIRVEDIAADLAPEGDVLLFAADLIELLLLLLQPAVVQPRPQHLHGRIAVAVLRTLVLARHDDAGRQVRDADGRVGDVHVLPSGAAGPIGVDPQILVVDIHVDFVRQVRPDEDRGKRGVAARGLIERRDPDQPVHPCFREEQAVRVIARHGNRCALDTRLVSGLEIDDLAREPAALRPPEVDAQQHLGPILRLGAAGAWMHGEDGVGMVVRAAEHLLGLGCLNLDGKIVEPVRQIVNDRLALAGPLDQDIEVVVAPLQRLRKLAVLLEPATAAEYALRALGVVPEVGRGRGLLQPRDFVSRAGCVKDSSANRPPA